MMRTLVFSFVLLAVPAAASAQVCPYGLVAVDPAHCCWPGQTFAPDRGTCAGAPQCPPGLSPYGETCIASSAAQPQAQPPAQPQPDGTLPPPPPPPANYQVQPPPAQMQMPVQQQVYGFPVRFEAKKQGQEFTVSVDNGIACRTPCEMTVAPGRHRVKVEGDARFDERMTFPGGPSTVVVEKRGGIAALGIASLAVGIPVAAVGAVATLFGYILVSDNNTNSNRTVFYAGIGMLAGGVTLAAVGGGVGFGLAGKNRVSFARASADDPNEPPVQLLSLGVVPTKGGAMAGATFAF